MFKNESLPVVVSKLIGRNALRGGFSILLLTSLLACTSNSGDQGVQNAPPEVDENEEQSTDVVSFVGAIKAGTEDVLRFEQNLWANIASPNRCGACHVEDVQPPYFVRGDDINLAYTAANALVNLSDPASSQMVEKVAGGHNCWTQNAAFCAERITGWITDWATESGVELLNVSLERPAELRDVSASLTFSEDSAQFKTLVYDDYLRRYCADCHRANAPQPPVQPYFASDNVDAAYEAAQSKMLFNTTQFMQDGQLSYSIDASASRLVVRLREEAHNCWDNDCARSANEMEAALEAFATTLEMRELDNSLVASKAMRIGDGTVMSSNGRVETNAIAIYKFKAGTGTVANDFSDGFPPQMDLTLFGDVEWVSNWGVRFNNGRLQASTDASSKLNRYIRQTGEYSIEAWVVPGNVTQEEARIISYSGGPNDVNFALHQNLYNYVMANRTDKTSVDGSPYLNTQDAREALQATLQHVVYSFDPFEGRSIYVNGTDGSDALQNLGPFAQEVPELAGGSLLDWDQSFAFILGNEADGQYPWRGTIRFLAVHNRVLAPEDIQANYEAGVGQKILLAFSVADHIPGMTDAYLVFQVEQFDDYSYLFNEPYFFSFTETPPQDVVIQGVRIGVNGREAPIGQAFANLNVTIPAGRNVSVDPGETDEDEQDFLSSLGAVIPLEKGPEQDEFFLSFDSIGTSSYTRVEPEPSGQTETADPGTQHPVGVRTFSEINASLSEMTGIPVTEPGVMATFEAVQQQMPSVEDINGFLVAHQMGVTQLAVKYCNILADDSTRRSDFFPNFSNNTFDAAGRDAIIGPLMKALVAHVVTGEGVQLSDQPSLVEASTRMNDLMDTMTATCGGGICSSTVAVNTITATCAAALGSAVMLIQ